MSYLHYLCLCVYSDVQHILCCVFVLFFFVYVASFSGLSIFFYCSSVFSNIYSELRDWRGTMEIYFWQQQKTQNQIEDLRNQTFFNYGLMLYLLLPRLYFIIIFMCFFVWILSSINYIKYTIYLFDTTTVELVQSETFPLYLYMYVYSSISKSIFQKKINISRHEKICLWMYMNKAILQMNNLLNHVDSFCYC